MSADWTDYLQTARAELRRYSETAPTLALPTGHGPAAYRWLVVGRTVLIYPALDTVLVRDGAHMAGGIDRAGALHTAIANTVEVAA